ncbi:MAG: V-type ATP synthase subunit D [Lachnospiraceae bacterium]|jgi:V/A-type H+-transporting ATPase subunit D|nr:V-type ATP synthase subunit D [Lachnospiraceae bacterium]
MAATTINPTRMELTRLKKKLVTARRGYKLLKDKRDELMRQFLDLVRENKELREKVESGIAEANRSFALARSGMSDEAVRVAFMSPKQEVSLNVHTRNIMSVDVPVYDFETRTPDSNDIYSYGFAFTSGDLDAAVGRLSGLLPDMLKLAESEKTCQMLASEIEKTRRRVNALEHVLIPDMVANIKFITMKLDENERSSQTRLMKVKDMMLEQAHHYSEKNTEPVQEQGT